MFFQFCFQVVSRNFLLIEEDIYIYIWGFICGSNCLSKINFRVVSFRHLIFTCEFFFIFCKFCFCAVLKRKEQEVFVADVGETKGEKKKM